MWLPGVLKVDLDVSYLELLLRQMRAQEETKGSKDGWGQPCPSPSEMPVNKRREGKREGRQEERSVQSNLLRNFIFAE